MQFSLYVELNIKGVMWSHLLCEGTSASGEPHRPASVVGSPRARELYLREETPPPRPQSGSAYRVRELIDPRGGPGLTRPC